ncbi:MAG TPA: winged helix-turn-helix domain-containing protein [Blastocatellia bacterium]|jgi:Tol biopolymer transport system component/DNA-binding winged helix-turn-helix (wHTH) protein|nr:winged helix-turn-helix domain-containing protein [Blastocatellia bacterium]
MVEQISLIYEFGPFRLDANRRLLLRGGKPVPLTHKAFETLAMLVQNNGRIVQKDELMREVWPDTFVEEGSLTRNISVLRKILGEGPSDHQYIETIPKRGYRFVASVRELIKSDSDVEEQSLSPEAPRQAEEAERSDAPVSSNGSGADKPDSGYAPMPNAAVATLSPARVDVGSRGRKRGAALILVLVLVPMLLALAGLAYVSREFFVAGSAGALGESMKVARFTTTGTSLDAAISPDGKYVVYVMDEKWQQSLWVKQVATASNVRIIPPADVSYQGLAFSPDGDYIFYNVWDKKSVGQIYKTPVLGGNSTRVIYDVMPSISVSPDGKQIAYIRGYASEKAQGLLVANSDGTGERLLAKRGESDWFIEPSWSPDGRKIACAAGSAGEKGISYVQLVELPVEGGPERLITTKEWLGFGGLKWLGDGSGLIMTAADRSQDPLQIWHISYPGGKAQQITSDVNGYGRVSLTSDSKSLVSVQMDTVSNVWTLPKGDSSRGQKITSGRYEGRFLSWTPDGRVAYVSAVSGNPDIWIMDADGSNNKQLTTGAGEDFDPQVSYDGRHIVFISNRTGSFHLWRMNIDGTDPKQMTFGESEWSPYCSPLGPWLVYISVVSGKQTLWKMSIEGGESVQLSTKYTYDPAISPDGKHIAYSFWDEETNPAQWGREIISVDGSEPARPFTLPVTAIGSNGQVWFRWMPDGRSLTYVDNRGGIANIWSQPVGGGEPKPLTDFKSDQIFAFAWSRDGRQLACSRGVVTSDVVLITDFK